MNKLATTFCLVVAWVLATPAALGFTVLTGQHLDLKVAYSDADGFSVFVEDVSRTEFALRDTLLFDGPAGTTGQPRPAGSQWDFLGVNAGETIYLWPQNFLMGRTYLGISSEGSAIPAGTFAAYSETDPRAGTSTAQRWLRLELKSLEFLSPTGVSEPADFSVWQTDSGANVTQWMATSDGIGTDDLFLMLAGSHAHVAWGFTKVGYYRAVFTVSGILAETGQRVTSAPFTVHFGVEHQPTALINPPGTGDGSTGGSGGGSDDGGVTPGKKPKLKIAKKSTRPTVRARHRVTGTMLNVGSRPQIEWSTTRNGKTKARKAKLLRPGRASWTVRLKLKPGRNTYFFRATDRDGNESKPVRVRIKRNKK